MENVNNDSFALIRKSKSQGTRLWKKRLTKFMNNRLAVLGLAIIVIMLLAFLFAPVLSPYDPLKPDLGNKYAMPSAEHLFGTDSLGRDIFTRLLYGGRTSVLIAVCSSVGGSLIALLLGLIGGFFGGWVDRILVRLSEVFSTFPQIILIMIAMTFMGQGVWNVVWIFIITGWPGELRLVRAEVLSLREETYVEVARAFGMSRANIMFKQILPSVVTILVVNITMAIPGYILSESSLSFLGIGVPSTVPTWGTMLNAARSTNALVNYWWVWVVPGLAICLFVLATNFLGDGLRDVLDPRQQ